jgi:hypothetical protein
MPRRSADAQRSARQSARGPCARPRRGGDARGGGAGGFLCSQSCALRTPTASASAIFSLPRAQERSPHPQLPPHLPTLPPRRRFVRAGVLCVTALCAQAWSFSGRTGRRCWRCRRPRRLQITLQRMLQRWRRPSRAGRRSSPCNKTRRGPAPPPPPSLRRHLLPPPPPRCSSTSNPARRCARRGARGGAAQWHRRARRAAARL